MNAPDDTPLQTNPVVENPKRFLRSIRLLAQSYQAFEKMSATHVRALGFSPAEFDVLATLGNTQGMRCKELGEQTLLTKGTLSGILDRMAARGDVERLPCDADGRGLVVRLTAQGMAAFQKVFPTHVAFGAKLFAQYRELDFIKLEVALSQLTDTLRADASCTQQDS